MGRHFDVAIVGTGHSGAQTAIALRQSGFAGSIAMIGEELELPYDRPPLSKDYFSGERSFERMLIRPAAFWQQRDVAILNGNRVISVDPTARTLQTQAGDTIGYGQLVWAAGGHARRLSCDGRDLSGVHSVRNRADVDRIRGELTTTEKVAVVGGGYIGLEAAAILTKMGKKVTVLEVQNRLLARVAGETLSRFYEAEHRNHGVEVRLGVTVESIEAKNNRVACVRLNGGELAEAQMVIVGIGIIPAVEPLLAAGALGDNGVAVDEYGRTTLPDIFAVGDCALHSNPYADDLPIRLESVQNANDLANTVARAITGNPVPYNSVPWFWSNQYDLRLQTIGLSAGYDLAVTRGAPADRSFSIIYLKQGRVIALDCVNATSDYAQGKALVTGRVTVDPNKLGDTALSLKELASGARQTADKTWHRADQKAT